jgi:beta-galactosidase
LIVTVDGKEAFNGTTQTTLGYYTIKCTPQTGKKVRIQLAGISQNKANDEVEVSGKKLDDGVVRDDAKAKGTLSIIEAEIYEPLKK